LKGSEAQRAVQERFRQVGHGIATHVSDVLPTASVRRRAARLAELIERTATGEGPIHLLGHSIGGLDARLVASPSARLPHSANTNRWLPRLRSVTTMNTPHYGTPLATFFATAKGQQALYALSAFTIIALSLGERPLAVASVLMGIIGRGDYALGLSSSSKRRAGSWPTSSAQSSTWKCKSRPSSPNEFARLSRARA
jgi:triacylglycerol lipase